MLQVTRKLKCPRGSIINTNPLERLQWQTNISCYSITIPVVVPTLQRRWLWRGFLIYILPPAYEYSNNGQQDNYLELITPFIHNTITGLCVCFYLKTWFFFCKNIMILLECCIFNWYFIASYPFIVIRVKPFNPVASDRTAAIFIWFSPS